jgi:hypothetical protein
LIAHGWWFPPGTPASSTTKIGRHEIAEILLKVALKIPTLALYYLNIYKDTFLMNIHFCKSLI